MAVITTHTFELKAGDLEFEGEIEYPSGTYTEESEIELPARLETDFKLLIDLLKKFHDAYGSLEKFEVKEKQ